MKKVLTKLGDRLGKAYLPILLAVFSLLLFMIMFGSVHQKRVEIKEGQLAEKTIRANKNIENTYETEQRKKLAAEAVTPEYIYQEDTASVQHNRIDKLFKLIDSANEKVDKEYSNKQAKAKKEETIPAPTVEERAASLKSLFESLPQDEVTFYQSFPNVFYQTIFTLTSEQLDKVRSESLMLVDDAMQNHVRESDLDKIRQEANGKIQYLDITSTMQQVIRYIVNQGIVVNDIANEKRTEELRQKAMNAVQPAMIYQGEIIVREGTQIDAKAVEKLELLGMTSQNTSIFPMVALALAILLQVEVLIFFTKQVTEPSRQRSFIIFYTGAMLISVILMKFFQIFQTEQLMYIPLFYPAAFAPLILNHFVNRRSGIIAAIFQVVFALFIFYNSIGTNSLTVILIMYLFSGFLATVVKRKRMSEQVFPALMWVVVFPVFMAVVLMIYQGMSLTDGKTWTALICASAGTVLSFLATMGLHPYIELLVTDDSMIVLNELSNPNHPLLKQLLEEAPGTYHHSMMVASLSANAVAEIGGRSLLTRVACYYHDIGKIKHANFFVENLPAGAENPHNFLLPEDSKQIIFGHVIDGAKILEEYNMPQMVIDICRQHHGTTLMKFFYVKAKERNPEIKESDFRYPGPRPQTREAGIVSIADTCEAAVRAMDHPTNEKIQAFVHNVIQDRISDGQLDECGLTMKEIRIIEKSLINGLCSTFHSRIKYPKMKAEAEEMKDEQEKRDD
ncbi:HDIG domain-containing protein [Enterococcus faecalis]|uniref:HD family phosphohydrolase n=1 Tax=Enterococcus faecalis TaxID=1351 RepID=UPI001D0A07B1|nr:HDIG domain-containing metalloprotein [Enterococcus faecalis]MCB8507605.1 HDIG domain-containing protein [Enterococcus faecalis]MCB8509360.1 HDIG domain-containing protein [Enterococcus faecalis]